MRKFLARALLIVAATLSITPAFAQGWSVAIEQNSALTNCGTTTNIPVAKGMDCPTAITAAQNLFTTLLNTPACLSYGCKAGETPQLAAPTCVPDPYTRPNGSPAMRWQIGIKWACVACTFDHDLSTGVAKWMVNNHPAFPTAPNPSWAMKDPTTSGPFPAGTGWIQPTNAGTAVNQPGGVYTYQIRFSVPKCAGTIKVHGWFAADNQATLQVDGGTPVPCHGNSTNLCFAQANVTQFSQLVGPGTHVITIKVTNASTSPSGLVADITLP